MTFRKRKTHAFVLFVIKSGCLVVRLPMYVSSSYRRFPTYVFSKVLGRLWYGRMVKMVMTHTCLIHGKAHSITDRRLEASRGHSTINYRVGFAIPRAWRGARTGGQEPQNALQSLPFPSTPNSQHRQKFYKIVAKLALFSSPHSPSDFFLSNLFEHF